MGSGSSDSAILGLQQAQTAALQQGAAAINKQFAGFTPAFYQQRQRAYEDYALPQLGQQYLQTQQQLGYQLANRGIGRSSAAQKAASSLGQEYQRQQQGVVNTAQQQSQQLEQQVGQEESALYGQLQASQDPTAVAQNAANLAAQSMAPSVFAPLGQMFQNWSNTYLASQNAGTYNPMTSSYMYNPWYQQTRFSNPFPGNTVSNP